MRGPGAKGHAEMAVSRVKGSGPETPAATPDQEGFNFDDFQDQQEVNSLRFYFPFWAHVCQLLGGLICIAFSLSVCLSIRH